MTIRLWSERARPELETWLKQANDEQRIALASFVACLMEDMSKSPEAVEDVIRVATKVTTYDYIRCIIDSMESADMERIRKEVNFKRSYSLGAS